MTVRSPLALVPALLLAAGVLAGCGDSAPGPDPDPHGDVTSSDAAVRIVGDDEADLLLYVSNQSFDEEQVDLTVVIDGLTVVDGEFDVAGQHNWVAFPLAMEPGDHELTATSDTGAERRESFRIPRQGKRYAVLDHWGEDGSAELTWLFQREPVAFA